MPPAEARMWNALRLLRRLGFHFRRQVPLGPYITDLACHHARLVIEIDGESHFSVAGRQHDVARDAFLRDEGYRILRFTNVDVVENIDGAMVVVMSALDGLALPTRATTALQPPPLREGDGAERPDTMPFAERAARGNVQAGLAVLRRTGLGRPPEPGDER